MPFAERDGFGASEGPKNVRKGYLEEEKLTSTTGFRFGFVDRNPNQSGSE
jgi:hypothetical protein